MYLASLICRLRCGYFFGENSALKQLRKSCLPLLIIHGDQDDYVPTQMSARLLEASGDPGEKAGADSRGRPRGELQGSAGAVPAGADGVFPPGGNGKRRQRKIEKNPPPFFAGGTGWKKKEEQEYGASYPCKGWPDRFCAGAAGPAQPAQRFAGSEFARLFQEITGCPLPQRSAAQPPYPYEVVLANARPCLGEPLSMEELGEEGFVLSGREKQLFIGANSGRGLLYGVYGFFEKYAGCRWFTETLRRIPQRDSLILPAFFETQKPAFSFRKSAFLDSDRWEFSLPNRLNAKLRPDSLPEHGYEVGYAIGFCHTLEDIIPDSLFDSHPEYFPMDSQGNRIHGPHTQRCLSHPQVLAMTIEKVRESFRADPNAKIASVTQADTFPDAPNHCRCPVCSAIDREEGSPAGSFLRYVNAVAEAIEEEFPDRYIDTFAYRYTRTPPKITRPRHNVILRLCSIECCFSHSLESCSSVYECPGIGTVDTPSFVRDLKEWAAMEDERGGRPNLHIWDYVVNFVHYLAPHPNLHCFQENLRFYRAHHVTGVYPEGAPDAAGSDMAQLKAYLLAKLQWDPDYDLEAGTREFVQAYCGAGAEPILSYLRELNQKPEREGRHMCCYEPPTREFFTPEFMAFANRCFDQAETLAENQQVLDRIRYWRMGIRYLQLWLYAGEMEEGEREEAFVSFFADCRRFGITTLSEGGSYQGSLLRMRRRLEEQEKAGEKENQ